MERVSEIAVKYRWAIFIIVILLTAFFGYQLKFVQVDSNIVNSLPKDDPVVSLFKDVGKKFGGNEMGMIILNDDNVLYPEVLKAIDEITDTLSGTNGILSVTSLTNLMNINSDGDDLEINNLINDANRPKNRQQADSLLKVITSNKMAAGNIISKDGSATIILITFKDKENINGIAKTVRRKIDNMHLGVKHYFAGAPFMTLYVSDVISKDLMRLIPISFLLIAFILFMSFHSMRGVLIPLLTSGIAIIWSLGLFVMAGFKLSMVSNNVPIIILAVGSAYTIHIMNRINQCSEKDKKRAVTKALALMIVPVALTALTTMIGFLSFIFGAYLSLIRDFGFLAALGTFFSALLALVFVPAVIAILPVKKKKGSGMLSGNGRSFLTHYFLVPLNLMVSRHRYAVLVVWILLFAVSIFGIFMIKRSVNVSEYFKSDHPASIADKIINEKFGGSKPVFVVFKGDMQNPVVLKMMLKTEKHMMKSEYVSNTQSVADVIAQLNGALGGEKKIPDDESSIQQLWFILDQQQSISRLVTEDKGSGIIIGKFHNLDGHDDIKNFNKYMQDFFKAHPSDLYTVKITGMAFVNAQLDKSLLHSQILSLIISIVLVIAMVSLMLSSLVKGLYAGMPIIATIAILFGIMGLTGIQLNIRGH